VGRPNVGKSTLFNRLTRSQDALVADYPGLTRDRQYGTGKVGGWPYIVVDTGGLSGEPESLDAAMAGQTLAAVEEADLVVFIVDGRDGLVPTDSEIADRLRRGGKRVLLCVNKSDGLGEDRAALEFHELGFENSVSTAASHNRGVRSLIDAAADLLGIPEDERDADENLRRRRSRKQRREDDKAAYAAAALADGASGSGEASDRADVADAAVHGDGEAPQATGDTDTSDVDDVAAMPSPIEHPRADKRRGADGRGYRPDEVRIGFIGRPNVGKSTLVNRLLGEERVIAFDKPGTTRDTVSIPFTRGENRYTLVDTAGIRRRGKVTEKVETFSIIKTLKAIEEANVCVMLIDAAEGLTEQDLHLLSHVIDKGRALIVAVNKWDALDGAQRDAMRKDLERRVEFLRFTRIHFISALHGSGVGELFKSIDKAHLSAFVNLATPNLTRLLELAVTQHAPPMHGGRRIKLRYAHQGGVNPPIIVVHGRQADKVPRSYHRFLANWFMKQLRLFGTPLRLEFREGDNPFAARSAQAGARSGVTRERQEHRAARESGRGSGGRAKGTGVAGQGGTGGGRDRSEQGPVGKGGRTDQAGGKRGTAGVGKRGGRGGRG